MNDLLGIVGQDAAISQLQKALQGGRRPHAFLFVGPEGVGRRTTALEFGKLLLCRQPISRPNAGHLADLPADMPLRVACGQCSSCRTASAGTNPDLILIYKELARFHPDANVRGRKMQELGIEVIRQFLLAAAHMTASGSGGRVFVVRQAELMSAPAQNALLKTLEEPPPGVSIILLATSAEELLPTTRSRCQFVRFVPLPLDFVTKSLESSGVSGPEAHFWAAMTGGSLGRGLTASQDKLFGFKRELVEALSALVPGREVELSERLTKAMETQAAKWTKTVKADQAEEGGGDFAATLANRLAGQNILALIVSVYRDALSVASASRRPIIHADQQPAIAAIAQRFRPIVLADILQQLARYEELLWRNVNAKLLWDNVAITCATGSIEMG